MARARLVAGSISNSAKLAALSCDGARLLFTWMIPHADNLGRLRGEPVQVKAVVLPRHPSTLKQIEGWLGEMAQVGLIHWYTHQEQRFIAIEKFDSVNRFFGNMKRESDLPDPQNAVCTPYVRRTNAVHTESIRRTAEVDSEVDTDSESKGKGNGETHPRRKKPPDDTITEQDIENAAKRFSLPVHTVQILAEKIWLEFEHRGYKSARSALLTWCKNEADNQKPTPSKPLPTPQDGEQRNGFVWWSGAWRTFDAAEHLGWPRKPEESSAHG